MSKKIKNNQYNGHDFVEIAGIKWATCNVGAEKTTDIGLYFQWGDRKGYTSDEVGNVKRFDDDSYKHCKYNTVIGKNKYYNGKCLTKYTQFDNKHVLDLCDDAAFAYMGKGWRMPTDDDFRSLIVNTRPTWIDNYQNSGIDGMLCNDITGDTKELFFPAAGHCYKNNIEYECGCYWSRSLASNGTFGNAYLMYFDDKTVRWDSIGIRLYGFSIRGILTD